MDNAYVTWRNVSLTSNKAALSVFDLWFGDAWVDGARVVGNQVQAGSIWNFESFRGRFQQVREACMLLTKLLQLQPAYCCTLQLPCCTLDLGPPFIQPVLSLWLQFS